MRVIIYRDHPNDGVRDREHLFELSEGFEPQVGDLFNVAASIAHRIGANVLRVMRREVHLMDGPVKIIFLAVFVENVE